MLFDILAWLAATGIAFGLRRWSVVAFPLGERQRLPYYAALLIGGAIGAYGLGTANLWLSGLPGVGRSIEGALFGAIIGVESYKAFAGVTLRTGAIFALPLAVGIAIGRVGCFLAGMEDLTYGLPTTVPWGHDFGDGIQRHPVQLYEALSMALFAIVYLVALLRRQAWPVTFGFPLVVLWYGLQRFVWEFFKPYGGLPFDLSVFHIVSLLLVVYALLLLRGTRHAAVGAVGN